jgi:hypothetical protein
VTTSTCATRPLGWKPKPRFRPVTPSTLARLLTVAPPALVKLPPSSTWPSGVQAAVSTRPLVLGFHGSVLYGAVAENAKALLRAIVADVPASLTPVNSPTAYIVPPHWMI